MKNSVAFSSAFTPSEKKVLERIQKLLNLAAKNPNKKEAEAASKKAQELLVQHNLDASLIEQNTGVVEGRREDLRVRGGFYNFQRSLWNAIADLNFCMYWTQRYVEAQTYKDGAFRKNKKKRRHRLVGRVINTTATKTMAIYLEEVIERELRKQIKVDGRFYHEMHLSSWANSFREGMADTFVERIEERSKRQLAKEQREERRERKKQAGERPAEGFSKALTLVRVKKSEDDANYDFLHGEGAAAQRDAEDAQWAREEAEREAAYVLWAKENPELARAQEEANRKIDRRYGSRGGLGRVKFVDTTAYHAGKDVAKNISLDQQVRKSKPVGLLKGNL